MGIESSAVLATWSEDRAFEVQLALAGFLAGYSGETRLAYEQDLRQFVSWCHSQGLGLLAVRRIHIEVFARWLKQKDAARATIGRRLSTIAGFYRYSVEEELVSRNPVANVRRPRLRQTSPMRGLDRNKLGAVLVQAGLSGASALACLLALNGLRVSEALDADVDDLGLERGHHTLLVRRKGGKPSSPRWHPAPHAPCTSPLPNATKDRSSSPTPQNG